MLLSGRELRNAGILATDGEIGQVDDIYFDDKSWQVRYIVVDTSKWLPGRRVLISPESVTGSSPDDKAIRLNLSREQIRESPDVSTDRPVSEQVQADLAGYYGWTYMPTGMVPAVGLVPSLGMIPSAVPQPPAGHMPPQEPSGDDNLRSLKEVLGYRVEAADGDLGRLIDLALSPARPQIEWLFVEANQSGKELIRVPVDRVIEIEWTGSRVRLRGSRAEIAGDSGV